MHSPHEAHYFILLLLSMFLTCCWAECWSIWCLCAGSCSCGSSPGLPSAGAWSCGCAHGRTGPGLTPAGPSGRGPCTQTPGRKHLNQREDVFRTQKHNCTHRVAMYFDQLRKFNLNSHFLQSTLQWFYWGYWPVTATVLMWCILKFN